MLPSPDPFQQSGDPCAQKQRPRPGTSRGEASARVARRGVCVSHVHRAVTVAHPQSLGGTVGGESRGSALSLFWATAAAVATTLQAFGGGNNCVELPWLPTSSGLCKFLCCPNCGVVRLEGLGRSGLRRGLGQARFACKTKEGNCTQSTSAHYAVHRKQPTAMDDPPGRRWGYRASKPNRRSHCRQLSRHLRCP